MHIRSFRFSFYIAAIGIISMMIGGAIAYANAFTVIACLALFVIVVVSMARSENGPVTYPSRMKVMPAAPVEPAIAMTPTMAFLPTNVPAMPSPMMVETNTPVRIDAHAH